MSAAALDISLGGKSFTLQNTVPAGSTVIWRLNVIQNADNPTANDWFSVSERQGTLAAGDSRAVILLPKGDLAEGKYNATVVISSGNEQKRIQVTAVRTKATSCIAAVPKANSRSTTPRKPDQEILVRYRTSETSTQAMSRRLNRRYNLNTVVSGEGVVPDVVVATDGNRDALIASLNQDPDVLYAVANETLNLQADPTNLQASPTIPMQAIIPNDALYKSQWYLKDFGIPQAWALETGKSNVTVAIVDSSVDTDHEDLVNALLPGCDLFNRDNDPNAGPFTPGGSTRPTHGTHTAGIVAATGNNGVGVTGVAFTGVRIVPVKVFNDAGVGAQIDDLINGIRWSAGLAVPGFNPNPYPANIINLSLGTRGENAAVNEAVAEAIGAGALVVAAAGNQSLTTEVLTPANAPGALSVGSVDSNYQRSSFSNYNQDKRDVDLVAPGGRLIGSPNDFCPSGNDNAILNTFVGNNYGCLAGTSMSAPFVAGVAALVWSQNPNFTAEKVKDKLLASTLSQAGQDPFQYGAGVLCADRALGAKTRCGK